MARCQPPVLTVSVIQRARRHCNSNDEPQDHNVSSMQSILEPAFVRKQRASWIIDAHSRYSLSMTLVIGSVTAGASCGRKCNTSSSTSLGSLALLAWLDHLSTLDELDITRRARMARDFRTNFATADLTASLSHTELIDAIDLKGTFRWRREGFVDDASR